MLINRESIAHYLKNILGMTDLELGDYPKTAHLPYLLQDQFEFLQMKFAKYLVTPGKGGMDRDFIKTYFMML